LQENVYLHMLLDGRDTPPQSAEKYITELQTGAGDTAKISTIMGRFYGMDRDDRWDRVEAAYNAMVHGDGVKGTDALFALKKSYEDGVYDEFVQPQVFLAADNDGEKTGQVKHGDSVIFFNFRADRMRELVRAFFDPDFTGFKRGEPLKDLSIVCMTEYESTFSLPVAFHPVALQNTLGEWLSKKGLKQFHTAETEKYAHVTFFFNGGVEAPVKGEARELIASPKVRTYDLKPEMSAHEVTDIVLRQVNEGEYDFIVVNLANPDMVGHTGNFEAAKKAVETIDSCVEKIVDRVQKKGGKILITADHGNIEKLLEDDGSICTAHTTNPVPFYCLTGKKVSLRSGGKLADIAPTILHMLDIRKPEDMTGESLILE
ncbi:MAG: 2,3-bisphosphoglycerate-independent phosphoglycerate mutase, partial [Nitrospinota bacterium]